MIKKIVWLFVVMRLNNLNNCDLVDGINYFFDFVRFFCLILMFWIFVFRKVFW